MIGVCGDGLFEQMALSAMAKYKSITSRINRDLIDDSYTCTIVHIVHTLSFARPMSCHEEQGWTK